VLGAAGNALYVIELLRALDDQGEIRTRGGVADVDAITVPISLRHTVLGRLAALPEVARELPEVVECYRITGEDCFFVKLHLRSMEDLEGILDRFVLYGQTTTSIVHSAPVSPRPLPLGDGALTAPRDA